MTRMTPLTLVLVILVPVILVYFGLSMLDDEFIYEVNNIGSMNGYIFFGTLFGVFYFFLSERSMMDNNRSYLANPITDILAFIGSSWVIVRGMQLEEGVLVLMGSAIWTIHLFQLLFKNEIDSCSVCGMKFKCRKIIRDRFRYMTVNSRVSMCFHSQA